jgi:hypothetical protein
MEEMKNTQALKRFLSTDQILDILVKFDTRKMEAVEMLQEALGNQWRITKLEGMGILSNVAKEWN